MKKEEFTMLAHNYVDVPVYSEYFVSRKLNGFLALWDGGITRGMYARDIPWYNKGGDKNPHLVSTGLWSRRGKVIEAPSWWLNNLPAYVPLQGEIWADDNRNMSAVCNTKGGYDSRWERVQYVVYNYKPYSMWRGIETIPAIETDSFAKGVIFDGAFAKNVPFSLKYKQLNAVCDTRFNNVGFVLKQTRLESALDLQDWQNTMIEQGWEGLILAKADGIYEPYRSKNLLKIKTLYSYEGMVVGYIDGKGKHQGRMGALIIRVTWDDSILTFHGGLREHIGEKYTFHLGGGFSDEEREWDYVKEFFPLGCEIGFAFNEVGVDGRPPSARYVKES